MLIWYIHGAHSTPLTFNWIKAQLPEHESYDVSYNSDNTELSEIISFYVQRAKLEPRDIYIIGHSLGGIIGAAIAKECSNVKKLFTISSPFGGSREADILQFFSQSKTYKSVSTFNVTLYAITNHKFNIPIVSVISTDRTDAMGNKSDGVVSEKSQKALRNSEFISLQLNHFEVLLSPEVSSEIVKFFWEDVV